MLSIPGNVLCSQNAWSSMKILPSVWLAVQISPFEWLTSFSISSLLNSVNLSRAGLFITFADWRKTLNFPYNLSLWKLPGKMWLNSLFNNSLIRETTLFIVKCKALLVSWVKHIARSLYGILEVSLFFSANSKIDSSFWWSADWKGFLFL